MSTSTLKQMNYNQLTVPQLIGEMLQLEHNCSWLRKQSHASLDRMEQLRHYRQLTPEREQHLLEYWHDCLCELQTMGTHLQIVVELLRSHWDITEDRN